MACDARSAPDAAAAGARGQLAGGARARGAAARTARA